VKSLTLHVPFIHVAVCDEHWFGQFSDDDVYHITVSPCSAVPHHGKSQVAGPFTEHEAY
jgi:hypothetical protein